MSRKIIGRMACLFILFALLFIQLPVSAYAVSSIKVVYPRNNSYYTYCDDTGAASGLQVELMDAIASKMNVTDIEYIPRDNIHDCILAVENGDANMILGLPTFFDGDTSMLSSSAEITTVDLCIMAPADIVQQIEAKDRTKFAAVFEHNTNNYQIVSNMGASLYHVVGSQQEVLDTVLSGKAQVMICDEDCIITLLEERHIENTFKVFRNNVCTLGYAISVRKGDDSLLRAVNDGIFKIRMSGQYEAILGKWSKQDSSVELRKIIRSIIITIAIASGIVLVYFFFSWRVRNILKKRVALMTTRLESNLQQLQQESDLRNQIIERAPNVMLLCDSQKRGVFMNAAAQQLSGILIEKGKPMPLGDIPVIGEIVQRALRRADVDKLGPIDDIQVAYRDNDKRIFRCNVKSARINENAPGFLIMITDVTDEEEKKQELIEKEKNVALSRLVAGIAHEIKNPLTGIQSFAELIKTERNNPQFWDYFAEYVPTETHRISKLIESLMNYAKPAKGIRTATDTGRLLQEVLYFLQTAVSNAQIDLELELQDNLWIFVDRDQLKQVLINISLNSLEAIEKRRSDEGSTDQLYRVSVSTQLEQGYVCIVVSDEGIGMSEDELQTCTDLFFTTKTHGTGLGLAISKLFVQENGGTMQIDSTLGAGTTITLRFEEVVHEEKNIDC